MRISLLFCFLFFQSIIPQGLFSQTDSIKSSLHSSIPTIAIDYYQGRMLKIYSESPVVNHSRYYSVDLLWQTNGSKKWHRSYGLPEIGVNFFYNYLGNDSILGRSVAICPNINIRIRGQKRWGAFFNLATGFAYFNKSFNRETNPTNLVIGSHITNMTHLCLNVFANITKEISINAGYSAFHFSTGHVSIPNYGFNDLAWNVGLHYKLQKTTIVAYHKDTTDRNKIVFNTRISLGYHQLSGTVSPSGGPLYPIYSITPFISKMVGTVNNLRFGLSAKYFTSYHDFMLSEGYFRGKESINSWVISAIFGDEWQIGRIGFLLEPSIKFYNPFYQLIYVDQDPANKSKMTIKRWISLKSGFEYFILKTSDKPKLNPAIGLYINTNRTQADYVDFSISCGF